MVEAEHGGGHGQSGTQIATPTMLKTLVRERHWHTYSMFKRAYCRAAEALDRELVKSTPSERTVKRWLSGRTGLPQVEHCAVLEAMFPGWAVAELFQPYTASDDDQHGSLFKEFLDRQHLQTYREFCKAYDDAARRIDNMSVDERPSERLFYRWLSGDVVALPCRGHCAVLEEMFPGHTVQQLFQPAETVVDEATPCLAAGRVQAAEDGALTDSVYQASVESVEMLRVGLTDVLAGTLLSEASVDDWEQVVLQLGRATRFRSPGRLVAELTSDLDELRRVIARSRSETVSRQLARVAAQLSGLMSLTLLKLDDRAGSRGWVRTARLLAAETNDQNLRAWVQAQEAYYHFYDKNLPGTIDAAQYAQYLETGAPGVGSALAAAVEARAHALLGRKDDTLLAIENTESYLSKLGSDSITPSAFGYNEAQLRFHEGNALTHLRETRSALRAQDRALELYPADDFMDRALILLDRVDCLTADGEVSSAIELAMKTLTRLEPAQAQGLIVNRARETLRVLPYCEIHRPDALELREAIVLLSEGDEEWSAGNDGHRY